MISDLSIDLSGDARQGADGSARLPGGRGISAFIFLPATPQYPADSGSICLPSRRRRAQLPGRWTLISGGLQIWADLTGRRID